MKTFGTGTNTDERGWPGREHEINLIWVDRRSSLFPIFCPGEDRS